MVKIVKVISKSGDLNEVQVTDGESSWFAHWTDKELELNKLKAEVLRKGVEEDLLERLLDVVSDISFNNGRNSMPVWSAIL